jgi:putative DNA primase/helicase
VTPVAYRPGALHDDWEQALRSVPADVLDWYQTRLGQGITGHMTPDDILLVQQGGGANGKSLIMAGIQSALGDYFLSVSHRALLGDPSQHPTELMDFRGARLAVLEELPEKGRLSIVRLKQLVGTPQITARRIMKDSVTFDASHTLILSTNYKPLVEETDHGTWRRLNLLIFPYRWLKPGEPHTGPADRTGDPALRERLKLGPGGQHEAVLAWLVTGAVNWHRAGRVMPAAPETVEIDTRAWRGEADLVLSYIDDRLIFDPAAQILVTDLRDDFNAWLQARGNPEWTDRTLASRFSGHSEVAARQVVRKNVRTEEGLSRRPLAVTTVPAQHKSWVGIRFRTADDPPPPDEARDAALLTGRATAATDSQGIPYTRPRVDTIGNVGSCGSTAGFPSSNGSSHPSSSPGLPGGGPAWGDPGGGVGEGARATCAGCGGPLDAKLAAAGFATHGGDCDDLAQREGAGR